MDFGNQMTAACKYINFLQAEKHGRPTAQQENGRFKIYGKARNTDIENNY